MVRMMTRLSHHLHHGSGADFCAPGQHQHGAASVRLLRDEGLLEFRRGRGVHVAGTPERGAVLAKAREFVQVGRRHGYDPEELIDLIRQLSP